MENIVVQSATSIIENSIKNQGSTDKGIPRTGCNFRLEPEGTVEFELYMSLGLNEMLNAFKNVQHTAKNDHS